VPRCEDAPGICPRVVGLAMAVASSPICSMTKRTHVHADGFHFRTMKRGEVDLAVDWAASEGWNPGLDDAACFHAADPGGFLIDFQVEKEDSVYPMIPAGAALHEMIQRPNPLVETASDL